MNVKLGSQAIHYIEYSSRHYPAVITARDTTAATLSRGDITASDFTMHVVIERYLYRARHYREFYFKLCTRIIEKLIFKQKNLIIF